MSSLASSRLNGLNLPKMRKTSLFFLFCIAVPALSLGLNLDSGLVARHPFNKKSVTAQKAIVLQTDASAKTLPVTTITLWISPAKSFFPNPVLNTGDRKRDRALFTEKSDDAWHWTMQCGKDGELDGPVVLAGQWTFIAMMYDHKNQEARFMVNEHLYKSRAGMGRGTDKITIGGFDGKIDDLRVYNRFLTAAELQALYGKQVTFTDDDLAVTERYTYKEKKERELAESVKPGDIYIVNTREFIIKDSVRSSSYRSVLKEGDSLTVNRVIDDWLVVRWQTGDTGFVSRSYLTDNAFASGSSGWLHTFKVSARHIFDFGSLRSWIIFLTMAVILFFAKRYFYKLDPLLNKLRRKDMYGSGGSKSGALSENQTFLNRIFPPRRFRWWPMSIGGIAGLALFILLFIDGKEVEWYMNEGINLLPVGFDRWIHWVLFGLTWFVVLSLVAMILESYVVTGPVIMWLRLLILLILNIMAFVVSIFLAFIVVIIIVVMIVLYLLASGKSNYRCPHCGGSFSAGIGNSGTCPHCGGGVST